MADVNDAKEPRDAEATYGLTELAALSGASERTIRYYQGQHLLPRPTKKGRDAVYCADHLVRLALISEMRDRGLNLQTIKDLVAGDRPAQTVSEWLGIDAALSAPWSDDRPTEVDHAQLLEILGRHGSVRPGAIGELLRHGFVTGSESRWTIPSPTLLDHAMRLLHAGIDVEVSARLRDLMRRRLAKTVDDMVKLLVDRVGSGFAGRATSAELATAVDALRPTAREMTGVILAQEVERALTALVQSGPKSVKGVKRR